MVCWIHTHQPAGTLIRHPSVDNTLAAGTLGIGASSGDIHVAGDASSGDTHAADGASFGDTRAAGDASLAGNHILVGTSVGCIHKGRGGASLVDDASLADGTSLARGASLVGGASLAHGASLVEGAFPFQMTPL